MAGFLPPTLRSRSWCPRQCNAQPHRRQPTPAACSSAPAMWRSAASPPCLLPPANSRLAASSVRGHPVRPQRGWPLACAQPGHDAASDGAGTSSDEAASNQDIDGQLAEVPRCMACTASSHPERICSLCAVYDFMSPMVGCKVLCKLVHALFCGAKTCGLALFSLLGVEPAVCLAFAAACRHEGCLCSCMPT